MSNTACVSSRRSSRISRWCRTCQATTEHSLQPSTRYKDGFNKVCRSCARARAEARRTGVPRKKGLRHRRANDPRVELAKLDQKRAQLLAAIALEDTAQTAEHGDSQGDDGDDTYDLF